MSSNKKPMISQDRRRLTVGNVDESERAGRTERPEDPRGLVKFLKSRGSLDFAASGGSRPVSEARRGSFTLSGVTTTDQDSFQEKKMNLEGADVKVNQETLKDMGIGIACRKGLKPETPNQDSFTFLHSHEDFNLYGVFDGHGICGHDVSNFVREILPKLFISDPRRDVDTKQCLIDAFVKTQEMVEAEKNVDCRTSGTTATMVYHRVGDDCVWVAHAGDSRAILLTDAKNGLGGAIELNPDHKPNTPAERRRIEERGGCVIFDGFYNHRVFKRGTVYPGLNMSRALGDMLGNKEAGISEVPDVKCWPLTAGKNFVTGVAVCSDGVWEFIENEEAAQLIMSVKDPVTKKVDPNLAADTLAKESWNRWMNDTGNEISDDITVMIQLWDRDQITKK